MKQAKAEAGRHRGGDPRPGTIIVHKKEHKFSSAGYDARRAQHAPTGGSSELKALQQHHEQHAHLAPLQVVLFAASSSLQLDLRRPKNFSS